MLIICHKMKLLYSILHHLYLFESLPQIQNCGIQDYICPHSFRHILYFDSKKLGAQGVWKLQLNWSVSQVDSWLISGSALVVEEVERRGSSWQSPANIGGEGLKPGKPVDYLWAHSHPSLLQCQLCFPEMTCSTPYQLLSNQPSTLGVYWFTDAPPTTSDSDDLTENFLCFFWELTRPTRVGY